MKIFWFKFQIKIFFFLLQNHFYLWWLNFNGFHGQPLFQKNHQKVDNL